MRITTQYSPFFHEHIGPITLTKAVRGGVIKKSISLYLHRHCTSAILVISEAPTKPTKTHIFLNNFAISQMKRKVIHILFTSLDKYPYDSMLATACVCRN